MKKRTLLIVLASALTSLPAFADTLSDGIAAYKKGDYAAAIKLFQTRVKQAPSDSVAHYYLASAYNRSNENGLALAQYKYCITLNNDKQVYADAVQAVKNLKTPVRKAAATKIVTTVDTAKTPDAGTYSDQLEALTDQLMKKHAVYLKQQQDDMERQFTAIDQQAAQTLTAIESGGVSSNVGQAVVPTLMNPDVAAGNRVRDAAERKKQWYRDQLAKETEMLRSEERLNAAEMLRRDPNWQAVANQ